MKLLLSLSLLVATLLSADDYTRANAAAAESLRSLDCEFKDCPPEEPKVIEKVIIKEVEKPIIVEKVVEKVIVKEVIVERDAPSSRYFANPQVDGVALDVCKYWANECGKPAADAFCQRNGYATSIAHETRNGMPPTRVIGSGQICDGGFCGRIISATCSR